MAVSDKLNYLIETKAAIRQAIADKGVEVADSDTFRSYAEKINQISSGAEPVQPLDPAEVYRNTRPADWLPMPTPANDEIYMLFHIPSGTGALLAFTVNCTESYTVELGTVTAGNFVADSSKTQTVASSTKYENMLLASEFGTMTADGFMQCMIKISGNAIETFEPSTHSQKPSPANFAGWNIMEILCKGESMTGVKCGSKTAPDMALQKLRYFCMAGTNNIVTADNMFYSCSGLITIPEFNTSLVQSATYMFNGCYSLLTIPVLDFSRLENADYMFYSCYSLMTIPQLNFSQVQKANNMFNNCRSLITIPLLDFSSLEKADYMFYNCYSLVTIPQLDTSCLTSANNTLFTCHSLSQIRFNPDGTWAAPISFILSRCSLMRPAIIEFFNSLPTITIARAITLTNNPGAPDLTEDDLSIATGKGWTVTR